MNAARIVREWMALAAAAVIGIGIAVLIYQPPWPWGSLVGGAIVAAATVAIWFAWGGAVVGVVVWLIPLLIATAAALVWPTRVTVLLVTAILVLPAAGWLIGPVGRALGWYIDHVGEWLLTYSLSRIDRRTRSELRRAIRGSPELHADARQLADRTLTIAAFKRREEGILAVEAPDLGWERMIRDAAAPVALYREMLEGQRTLDFDLAESEVKRSRLAFRELLRSRSLGYRILIHHFVVSDDAPTSSSDPG